VIGKLFAPVIDRDGSSQSPEVSVSTPPATPPQPAFSAIYSAEFAFVVRSLRRLGVPPADLEDVTHEVFITAFRRRSAFDATRPIKPWLFGIAFRLASDFRRLVRHGRELPLDRAGEAPDGSRSPDEAAALAQDRRLVLDALGRIDLARRAVFIMHDIEELPVPEIADALEIPSGTAYSRLRAARAEFADAVRTLRQGGQT
jgi:RNA polymerase sigma-70 factor (ECF subfamily)